MRVLVTGSSGLVGAAIASRLEADGHEVVGLGRRLTKSNRLLTSAVAADLGRPGAASMLAEGQRCDAIVHAAASLDHDPYSSSLSLTNGLGTQQMIELADRWQVASFVFISSVPVIGLPSQLPITEQHPTVPPTAYHATKLFGEHLVALAGRAGMPAISLRLTAPVGPGMPAGRILPVFVRRALAGEPLEVAGRGTRGQDYVDVRDVAAAVSASVARGATGLLNIASGRCVENLELAGVCVDALSSASEVRLTGAPDPEEGVRWEVSIEAAQGLLGYAPQWTLEQTILAIAGNLRNEAGDD